MLVSAPLLLCVTIPLRGSGGCFLRISARASILPTPPRAHPFGYPPQTKLALDERTSPSGKVKRSVIVRLKG
jgi:hypothetical protein